MNALDSASAIRLANRALEPVYFLVTVTVALADLVVSATLIAVTETVTGDGTLLGAL